MEKSIDVIQRELKEEKRKSDLIRNVSFELNKLSSLEEKLNNILALLDTNFDLKHSMLLFPNKDKSRLRVFASRGFENEGLGIEVPFNHGVVGVVASKMKKLRISRLSQYRRFAMAVKKKVESNVETNKLPSLPNSESQVVLPLIANNELVAVLSCESEDIQFFHQTDEDLLMTLSQQIAISIQNSIVFGELEERVKKRTLELENLNKTKDRLFSIIGHDLRSPVTSLEGIAELFEYYIKEGKEEKLHELGPKISYAAKNVNQLLDNLLNWSLSQQDGIRCLPEVIELELMVNDVEQIFKDAIHSKSIEFVNSIKAGSKVLADYSMIFSVLRNLVSNAIKFTPHEGRIEISSSSNNGDVKVRVQDNGVGISKDKMGDLFKLKEKKTTLGTDRERGSGLGLLLVKEFCQLNKGSIELQSSDKGTSAILLLPKG